MSELAVYGGEKCVPEGTVRPWPPIDQADEDMVLASLRGRKLQMGPNCLALQQEFAEWNGNRFCVTTNSGTAALHMGLVACGVGAGDHVLAPAYSWSSSATCIMHHNAIPVFVDIDFETINMDLDRIEAAITPRTKAIVAVHLHGLALNMDKLMAVAQKHDLRVVEDACQSYGAKFKGRKVGTFGDCAAFSRSQNKSLCSGEGGLFVTDDQEKRDLAQQVWSFGECRTPSQERDYHAYALGWMYRNSDVTSALARSQLKKLDYHLQVQRENTMVFHDKIKHLEAKGLILPTEPEGHTHSWYEYVCRLDTDRIGWPNDPVVFRDAVRKTLQAEGVRVTVWQRFILPQMTVFQARNAYGLGTPWSIDNAGDGVEYRLEDYPAALRHAQTHIGLNMPLRAPNDTSVAGTLAAAYCKVFESLDRIDPEKIERITAQAERQKENTTLPPGLAPPQ